MSNWNDVHVPPPQGGGLLDGLLVHQAAVQPVQPQPPQPNGEDAHMQNAPPDAFVQGRTLPQPLPVGPVGPPLGGLYLPGSGGAPATGAGAPDANGYRCGVFSGKGGGFPSFGSQQRMAPGPAPQFFNIGNQEPPWRQDAGQGARPSAQQENAAFGARFQFDNNMTNQDLFRQMMGALGEQAVRSQQSIDLIARTLAGQGQQRGGGDGGNDPGYRHLKPKKDITHISGRDAKTLMLEWVQFEIDLGELGVVIPSEAAYRQLRAMVTDKAKDVVDLELARGDGKQLLDELNTLSQNRMPQDQRDQVASRLYRGLKFELERVVRLTASRRCDIATEMDKEAVMTGDTPADADAFLGKWRRAQRVMYRENLVNMPAMNHIGLIQQMRYCAEQGVMDLEAVVAAEDQFFRDDRMP